MTDKQAPSNTVPRADPLTGRSIYEKYCHDCANKGGLKCCYCSPPLNAFEWRPIIKTIESNEGVDQ